MMKMKKSDYGHQKRKRCNKKGVKVVYISSPMKVKTCASKFRALVQELTGKDSDSTCCFPDRYAFQKTPELPHHHHRRQESSSIGGGSHDDHQYSMISTESPTFYDATAEPIDQYGDVFREKVVTSVLLEEVVNGLLSIVGCCWLTGLRYCYRIRMRS
ncbi:hypothetical protein EZV62_025032 [Acer yangbiense]|uniref:VQ domain-containing protein n=1 Tax=Acer yangbiense TaxID=1000413 RepID=A0A5C7GXE3_9ROSI|nr:hypothetical protein EZV62_025032 [Acer yangbiense]